MKQDAHSRQSTTDSVIRESFEVYRQLPEAERETTRADLGAKVLEMPAWLWTTAFQSDPRASDVISRAQGSDDARAALCCTKEPAALGEHADRIDRIRREYRLEDGCRQSACRQSGQAGLRWDTARLEGYLSVLGSEFPELASRLKVRARQDMQARQGKLDAPFIPPDGCLRWTARIPARFLVSYRGRLEGVVADGDLITTTGIGFPEEGLRRLEEEYREFFMDNPVLLEHAGTACIVNATVRWSDGVWVFDFQVSDKGATSRQDLETALLEYLSGQLSDGWGEDLTRYERLVGCEVWQPHFDEDPATWDYGMNSPAAKPQPQL